MDLQLPLPIRLAASSSFEETTATPETPDPPDPPSTSVQAPSGPAQSLSPNPLVDEPRATDSGSNVAAPLFPALGFQAATGPSNHQFWLKDAKVAEELFTVSL